MKCLRLCVCQFVSSFSLSLNPPTNTTFALSSSLFVSSKKQKSNQPKWDAQLCDFRWFLLLFLLFIWFNIQANTQLRCVITLLTWQIKIISYFITSIWNDSAFRLWNMRYKSLINVQSIEAEHNTTPHNTIQYNKTKQQLNGSITKSDSKHLCNCFWNI